MANVLRKKSRSETSPYAESEVVPLNPVDAPPQTVGDMLRAKREEFDIDLREAAEYLRIRYAYLLALEEGRVNDLPGAAYALGFVRAYADYLGLDGAAVVERYKDETAGMDDDVRLVFPSPLPEGKIPSGAIVLISIVALILVYIGWVVFAQQNVRIAELVPALPERFASLLGSDESGESAAPAAPEPVQTPPAAVTTDTPDTPTDAVAESGTQAMEREPAPQTGQNEEATPAVTPTASEPAPVEAPRDEPDTPVSAPVAETPAEPASVAVGAANDAPALPQPSEVQDSAVQADLPETTLERETTSVPSVAVPSATAPSAAAPTDIVATGAAGQAALETPATPADTTAETPSVATEEAAPLPPKPPALASAGPRQYGSENAASRVMIRARVDSWVEIRAPDGEKLLTRVLRAGDSYRVPDRPGLRMETGNAGGLEISVDGQIVPDIGPRGAVRREIALDANSLKPTAQ